MWYIFNITLKIYHIGISKSINAETSLNNLPVDMETNSVNFEIEVDQNELTIFFMGHKYWELTK